MNQDVIGKLQAPFTYEEVEAKIQVTTKDKTKGMVVFYLDSRAIQSRLDVTVGPFNWSNHYSSWQDKAQICGISIYDKEREEWIAKYDGAENTGIEAVKGGLTDAFKRAAVLWGIGRYLYQMDGVWVEIEQRGNSSVIKDNQQCKLKAAYEAAVNKIFGSSANQKSSGGKTSGNTGIGSTNSSKKQQPSANTQSNQQPPAPPVQQGSSKEQQPPIPQTPVPQTQNSEQDSSATAPPASDFKIHNIKPAGNGSQLLELCDENGEILAAYVKPGAQGIVVGAHMRNVQIEEKNNSYGKYNLIADYEIAAA